MQGNFEAQDPRMKEYLRVVKQMVSRFLKAKVVHMALGQNRHAYSLATLASSMTEEVPRLIKVELVAEPSINAGVGVSQVTTIEPCWMDPIINFLAEDCLPADKKEAEKVHQITARYWLSANRKLYRRSFDRPYLQCLHPNKIEELLAELHDGVCGSHVGGRSLAHRAMTQGFWWLRMQWDAAEYARKCEQCQRHAPMTYQPAGSLNPISSPWPFAQWGLDIVGPFPRATGNQRFVLVVVDYFTNKFVWRNIVIRFRVPESLVSDKELQFDS